MAPVTSDSCSTASTRPLGRAEVSLSSCSHTSAATHTADIPSASAGLISDGRLFPTEHAPLAVARDEESTSANADSLFWETIYVELNSDRRPLCSMRRSC